GLDAATAVRGRAAVPVLPARDRRGDGGAGRAAVPFEPAVRAGVRVPGPGGARDAPAVPGGAGPAAGGDGLSDPREPAADVVPERGAGAARVHAHLHAGPGAVRRRPADVHWAAVRPDVLVGRGGSAPAGRGA